MLPIKKLAMIMVCFLILYSISVAGAAELSDIDGHWAEEEIRELVGIGAITGYPDETYRPAGTITRAEFSSVLRGALGLEVAEGASFPDIVGHWGQGRIEALILAGVIDTDLYGQYYRPDGSITREEIAMMTVRMLGEATGATEIPFIDAGDVGEGFHPYVAEAHAQGIILGYPDDTFRPRGTATRAEAAVMAIRTLRIIAETEDIADVDFGDIWIPANEWILPPGSFMIPPPSIVHFSSDKSIMTEGTNAILSWEVSGRFIESVIIEPYIGEVNTSGTYTVSPTETTNYTLTAINVSGSAIETVNIAVNPPLVIQPGLADGKDSVVSSLIPYDNVGHSVALRVGGSSEGVNINSFIHFHAVDYLPAKAVIEKASLDLLRFSDYRKPNFSVGVHTVKGSWNESFITWNNQPSIESAPVSTIPIVPKSIDESGWLSWDVTSLVQDWVDGSIANYGIALVAREFETKDVTVTYMRASEYTDNPMLRPRLVITYYVP